jgi:hypothetical protein
MPTWLKFLLLGVLAAAAAAGLATAAFQNEASSSAAPPATAAQATTTTPVFAPDGRYRLRGVYDFGSAVDDWPTLTAAGFDAALAPIEKIRALRRIARAGGKVWVQPGHWDNSTCSLSDPDALAVRKAKAAVATGGVIGFYLADEPDLDACPNAPAALAARNALLHRDVPGIETVIVLYEHITQFARSADALALDPYPCQYGHCDYGSITEAAAEADRAGVKYYGIVQAFGEPPHYDLPTTAQLHRIFATWRATDMSGYFVFAWSWPVADPSLWVESRQSLLSRLRTENSR